MKKVDVLVIGGSAAGLVAAMTSKSNNPKKEVMVVRREEKVMIPCGIPYIFGTLGTTEDNILPDAGLHALGVEIKIDTVVQVDTDNKTCKTEDGTEIQYEKLIFATGSQPIVPGWLKGADLENVYTIPKNKVYLDGVLKSLDQFENIIVVGAGFIGVETSDELNKLGKNVTLIEIQDRILGMAFDADIASDAEEKLKARGVNVRTGIGIQEIIGNGKVDSVKLSDGSTMKAEAVVLSMGYRPNTELAEKTGLAMNEKGFIAVDEYMRTSISDIFAAGDCASKRDFATGKLSTTMLASTACAEARVAGLNLDHLSTYRSFKGTIGIYSTNLGESSYGVAGLTEEGARREGFHICTGTFSGIDRHPGKLNRAHKQLVKLIVSKDSGRILGGEAIGGDSVGELINVIGFIVQAGFTLTDLLVSQIGTQPMLTASPAAYPLIKAAEVVLREMKK
ncbi:FAD-dependent oxidoreductase [Fusibacter tunisiensis]|uniref:NADPH-dependent 2,4-dienoyl-CoA reductase/sulfur reductase-like enzyme n=1 Tax=Fusibacter tunisiensis TaxID=1008308 RepID=A0ABS2MP68_9FIRM|nr:FAD-dependent oxidoreductase [Fusibacter tunisiensis]MBM7561193.1 NADPH-dependent 2,4-dienoyl-CoA reductase/sulfur reductase-like enzyme [Fusibacter tunisiensis]